MLVPLIRFWQRVTNSILWLGTNHTIQFCLAFGCGKRFLDTHKTMLNVLLSTECCRWKFSAERIRSNTTTAVHQSRVAEDGCGLLLSAIRRFGNIDLKHYMEIIHKNSALFCRVRALFNHFKANRGRKVLMCTREQSTWSEQLISYRFSTPSLQIVTYVVLNLITLYAADKSRTD